MIEKLLKSHPVIENYLDGIIMTGEINNITETEFLNQLSNKPLEFSSANGYHGDGQYIHNNKTYDKLIMIGANNNDIIATTQNLSHIISNNCKYLLTPTGYNGSGYRLGKIKSDDIFITRLVMDSSSDVQIALPIMDIDNSTIIDIPIDDYKLDGASLKTPSHIYILWKKINLFIVPKYIFYFAYNQKLKNVFSLSNTILNDILPDDVFSEIGKLDENSLLNINEEFYNRNVNAIDTSILGGNKININSSIYSKYLQVGDKVNINITESTVTYIDSNVYADDDILNDHIFIITTFNPTNNLLSSLQTLSISPENAEDPDTHEVDGNYYFVNIDTTSNKMKFRKEFDNGMREIIVDNFSDQLYKQCGRVLNLNDMIERGINFNTIMYTTMNKCDNVWNPTYSNNTFVYGLYSLSSNDENRYGICHGITGKSNNDIIKSNIFLVNNLSPSYYYPDSISENNATNRYLISGYSSNDSSNSIITSLDETYYIIPKINNTNYKYVLGFGYYDSFWINPIKGPSAQGKPSSAVYNKQYIICNRAICDASKNYIARVNKDGECKLYSYDLSGKYLSNITYNNLITTNNDDPFCTNYWDIIGAINTHQKYGFYSFGANYNYVPKYEISPISASADISSHSSFLTSFINNDFNNGKITHIAANKNTRIADSSDEHNEWNLFLGRFKAVSVVKNSTHTSHTNELRFYPGYTINKVQGSNMTNDSIEYDNVSGGEYLYILPSISDALADIKISCAYYSNNAWQPNITSTNSLDGLITLADLKNYHYIITVESIVGTGMYKTYGYVYAYDKSSGDFKTKNRIGTGMIIKP